MVGEKSARVGPWRGVRYTEEGRMKMKGGVGGGEREADRSH